MTNRVRRIAQLMPERMLPDMRHKRDRKVARGHPHAPNREKLQREKAAMPQLVLRVDHPHNPINEGAAPSENHQAIFALGAPLAALEAVCDFGFAGDGPIAPAPLVVALEAGLLALEVRLRGIIVDLVLFFGIHIFLNLQI